MSMNLTVYVGPFAKCEGGVGLSVGGVRAAVDEDLSEGDVTAGGPDYWMPNRSDHGKRFNRDKDNEMLIVHPGEQVSACASFQRRYETAINKLRELYGADNVEIVWGVVPYWS
jgi:hypothetical protein